MIMPACPAPPSAPLRLEIADVLRTHGSGYRQHHTLSSQQAKVMGRLTQCRTAALGGHVEHCTDCDYQRVSYNSCRDRHCPKCQAAQREQWIETRLQRVLPVPHFHVVFTLPQELNPLALAHPRVLYNLLFEAASATLLTLAADPRRLGAQLGFTAILHTWSQTLAFHPHLHCVVTAGGLSPDAQRWIATKQNHLLPVKVMGKLFRGKFLHGLQRLYENGKLTGDDDTHDVPGPTAFATLRDRLYRKPWVVYAKPPFGGVEQVFRYLGRYSHRVAIANARLLTMDAHHVRFRYKDYADAHRWKVMQLTADEFIRRFLMHVLPHRFVRIRHYGLMAARHVDGRLARARALLEARVAATPDAPGSPPTEHEPPSRPAPAAQAPKRCPRCQQPLSRYELLPRVGHARVRPLVSAARSKGFVRTPTLDSS